MRYPYTHCLEVIKIIYTYFFFDWILSFMWPAFPENQPISLKRLYQIPKADLSNCQSFVLTLTLATNFIKRENTSLARIFNISQMISNSDKSQVKLLLLDIYFLKFQSGEHFFSSLSLEIEKLYTKVVDLASALLPLTWISNTFRRVNCVVFKMNCNELPWI